MKKIFPFLILVLCLAACDNDAKKAAERVALSQQLIEQNNLNQAKIELDSIHLLFPREVPARRQAKYLQDSIVYIEAQRTLAYSDSLLQPLFPQVDELMKHFRHEKQEKYEDEERYVHQLLNTGSNTTRCFLQVYVNSAFVVTMKSYYYGSRNIKHTDVEISNGTEESRESGSLHSFEAEGWHEITTLPEEASLNLLNFVSAYRQQRLKVSLYGTNGNYIYYLQENEKKALEETYILAVLMKDIHRLEQQINIANRQIAKWENKQ